MTVKLLHNYLGKAEEAEGWEERGRYLILGPGYVIGSAIDIIAGIVVGCAGVVSFGLYKPVVDQASDLLWESSKPLSLLFHCFISAVNPEPCLRSCLDLTGDGLITQQIKPHLIRYIRDCQESDSIIQRHLVARALGVSMALVMIVTRITDLALGLIAASLAIGLMPLSCFGNGFLNITAYRGLQGTRILYDLFQCTMIILNPSSLSFKQGKDY